MIVCFDTLAEEAPQAFSSRTRVLKQLGSGFGGGFNVGSCPLAVYCLGTEDWRPGDLHSYYSYKLASGPEGRATPFDCFWGLFHLFFRSYNLQVPNQLCLPKSALFKRLCRLLAVLREKKNVPLALFESSVLLSRPPVFKRWGISEPGRAKSGLLLSYPQLPLHVGFQLGAQRFPAVWLDAVPEKPHQMPTPLAREKESVGWGKEGSKTPGLWLFFFFF